MKVTARMSPESAAAFAGKEERESRKQERESEERECKNGGEFVFV